MDVNKPFAAPQQVELPPVTLEADKALSLASVEAVARGAAAIALSPQLQHGIAAAHGRLQDCIAQNRLVYGVTTGFGPLANRLISPADGATLQTNLINHLATGTGPLFSYEQARAIALARLSSIAQGWSGASTDLADALIALLNAPLAPAIPQQGTVGASGDLTPLAHMALALAGKGDFLQPDGARIPPAAALAQMGRAAMDLSGRDGLALVNGTSAMTGVAALNGVRSRRLLGWAEKLSIAFADLLSGRREAWHPAFSEARPHPGQRATANTLWAGAQDSPRMTHAFAAERILTAENAGSTEDAPAQDAYSLRCVPQILGAVRDALDWHDCVIERELNAATDNPIFPADVALAPALHGGNFMGQHVAFAADTLSNAVLTLAGLAERQIARITDERLNNGLPAFLHRGRAGLNSGLMGAQVTATALLAEMRSQAAPASVQSLSTNGANQDVVSMGTIAARKTDQHLTDAAHILAIAALAVAQGCDILDAAHAPFSGTSRHLRDRVRRFSEPLAQDRPLSDDIAALARHILGENA